VNRERSSLAVEMALREEEFHKMGRMRWDSVKKEGFPLATDANLHGFMEKPWIEDDEKQRNCGWWGSHCDVSWVTGEHTRICMLCGARRREEGE